MQAAHVAIDMWSLGCIAAELYLGLPLYPGKNECTQLRRIQEMQGKFPVRMLQHGKKTSKFYHVSRPHGNQPPSYVLKTPEEWGRMTNTAPIKMKKYHKASNLYDLVIKFRIDKRLTGDARMREYQKRSTFIEFLRGVLALDPLKRWTPWEAIHTPSSRGSWTRSSSPLPSQPEPGSPGRPKRHHKYNPNSPHKRHPERKASDPNSSYSVSKQMQQVPSSHYAGNQPMVMAPLQLAPHGQRHPNPQKSRSVPDVSAQMARVASLPTLPSYAHARGPSHSSQNSPQSHHSAPHQNHASPMMVAPIRHHSMPQQLLQQALPPIVQLSIQQKQNRARAVHGRNRSLPSINPMMVPRQDQYSKAFALSQKAMQPAPLVGTIEYQQQMMEKRRRGRHKRNHSNPNALHAMQSLGPALVVPITDGSSSGATTPNTGLGGPSPFSGGGTPLYQYGLTPGATPPNRMFVTYRTPSVGITWQQGWPQVQTQQQVMGAQQIMVPQNFAGPIGFPPRPQQGGFVNMGQMQGHMIPNMHPMNLGHLPGQRRQTRSQSEPAVPVQSQMTGQQLVGLAPTLHDRIHVPQNQNVSEQEQF